MKKQLSLLTISIALLTMLSSTHIQSAAELPAINIQVCKELWEAAKAGDIERAQQALAGGADINMYAGYRDIIPNSWKLPLWTPLHIATYNGNFNMVKFLLEKGASVDALISIKNTPLAEICEKKNLPQPIIKAIITELLAHKANVNTQQCHFQNTPLHHVIYTLEDETIAQQLILAGADVTVKNNKGKTALDMIKTPSMREAVENALEKHARTQQDTPPSYEAARAAEPVHACAAQEAPPAYVPIICHKCTFPNPDYARQCEACDTPLQAGEANEEIKEAFYAKATQAGAADAMALQERDQY